MCERILVPEENLYPAGDLSLRDAAMIEFQAIGAHAVRRSELKPGDRVLVVGAGPIGVGTGILARLAGGEVELFDAVDPAEQWEARKALLRAAAHIPQVAPAAAMPQPASPAKRF